jgi:hypothetical protein
VVMKNLKSPPETGSEMSGPAQHAEMYMRTCEIESYKEVGKVYNRDRKRLSVKYGFKCAEQPLASVSTIEPVNSTESIVKM